MLSGAAFSTFIHSSIVDGRSFVADAKIRVLAPLAPWCLGLRTPCGLRPFFGNQNGMRVPSSIIRHLPEVAGGWNEG